MRSAAVTLAAAAVYSGMAGAAHARDRVETPEDAKVIARAAWTLIYGEEDAQYIMATKAVVVKSKGGVWEVVAYPKGCDPEIDKAAGVVGAPENFMVLCHLGAPFANIAKKDGAIRAAGHLR